MFEKNEIQFPLDEGWTEKTRALKIIADTELYSSITRDRLIAELIESIIGTPLSEAPSDATD